MYHLPVLLNEVIELLRLEANMNCIDATAGGGGHTFEILKHTAPQGKVVAIDADRRALREIESRITDEKIRSRLVLVQDNFRNLSAIIAQQKFKPVHAILFDLGMSSYQIDTGEQGFSFQRDAPLDMRFGGEGGGITAAEVVNTYSKQKLTEIFKQNADITSPRAIAERIIVARKKHRIATTPMLVGAVLNSPPEKSGGEQSFSPPQRKLLVKVWQALRMEVNQEKESLGEALNGAFAALSPQGRMAVIAYHSGEDRIVKHFFRNMARGCICPKEMPVCVCHNTPKGKIITKKPIRPKDDEVARNSRARSARLRVMEKI